jgi:hypothetical protein
LKFYRITYSPPPPLGALRTPVSRGLFPSVLADRWASGIGDRTPDIGPLANLRGGLCFIMMMMIMTTTTMMMMTTMMMTTTIII